jgi:hypothetical protein
MDRFTAEPIVTGKQKASIVMQSRPVLPARVDCQRYRCAAKNDSGLCLPFEMHIEPERVTPDGVCGRRISRRRTKPLVLRSGLPSSDANSSSSQSGSVPRRTRDAGLGATRPARKQQLRLRKPSCTRGFFFSC